jgi:hypothetical protein
MWQFNAPQSQLVDHLRNKYASRDQIIASSRPIVTPKHAPGSILAHYSEFKMQNNEHFPV